MIEYFEVEDEFDGFGNCVLCKKYRKLDPHHRVKRRYDKKDESVVWLCRRCHEWVETHPEKARELNLEIKKHGQEERDFGSKDRTGSGVFDLG